MSTKEVAEEKVKLKEEQIELHRAFTRYLIALLQSDTPIKANQLDTTGRFLKDNGITLDKLEEDSGEQQQFESIEYDLPFKTPGDGIKV